KRPAPIQVEGAETPREAQQVEGESRAHQRPQRQTQIECRPTRDTPHSFCIFPAYDARKQRKTARAWTRQVPRRVSHLSVERLPQHLLARSVGRAASPQSS